MPRARHAYRDAKWAAKMQALGAWTPRTWTHPSLERPAEYSVDQGRVLKGRVIIAIVNNRQVYSVTGEYLGDCESPAHAMLMAIHNEERPR